MRESTRRGVLIASTAVLGAAFFAAELIAPQRPTQALPIFARRYSTPCSTCHTIAPKLNKTGLAFEANHFNWPNDHPKVFRNGLDAIPLSAMITNVTESGQNTETLTAFQTLELIDTGGFNLGSEPHGGYWLDYFAATNDNQRASDLGDAWVAVPVAGKNGQFAVTAGQFSPLMYQWDPNQNLTTSLPASFDDPVDGISLDGSQPGVRLEYFDNRRKMSANGDYVDVGVPYDGHLTFNKDSMVDGPHGVYLHAFKRVGWTTAGVLLFNHDNNRYGALIGTRHIGHYVYLMGAAADAHDENGELRHLEGQVDVVPYPWLSFTGRYVSITGATSDAYPVFNVTVYPGKMYWLRLSAETVQQRASRSSAVFAIVQL